MQCIGSSVLRAWTWVRVLERGVDVYVDVDIDVEQNVAFQNIIMPIGYR